MIGALSMLGILVFAIGAFVLIATWDSHRGHPRFTPSAVGAYVLMAGGGALFVAGIFF